jgi:DNA-binding LytR/AlgR family response regulator
MRVLIVDDEPAARRRLAMLIEEIDPVNLEIVGEAEDGLVALSLARERAPDVILLDIAMREVDGFDVARHLPAPRPLIIFQTAHHQFALQAFEHEALDYVVKPIRKERLAAALERARARLAATAAADRPALDAAALQKAGAAFGYTPVVSSRLLVRAGAGHRLTPLQDILRFSAGDGVVYAHTATSAPIADYTLTELEARTGGRFVRTSRGDLVNLAHVERLTSSGDGSLTLTLSDATHVRVSRRRAADVRRSVG